MRTAVVVNTRARALRRDAELADAIVLAASRGSRVWTTSTLPELSAAASEIVAWHPDRVVLCGGDGTLMGSVSALANTGEPLPEVVVAPGGTVATVARNWGQRAGLVETVRLATAGVAPRRTLETPTLRLVDDRVRIGFIFGTGLVARFFERYYESGAGGYAAAARIVARVFVGSFIADAYSRSVLEPLPCRLLVDGRRLEPEAYSLVVASVVKDLGLHMWVTYRAGEDPDRPHVVASPLATAQLGPQAPRVLAGQALSGEGNFDGLVSELVLEFPGDPGPWVLDGDVIVSEKVVLSAGPRLRVAVY